MGTAKSSAMCRRVKNIELLINLADDFSNMIRYNAMTISELIQQTSQNSIYGNIDFIKKISERSAEEYDIHSIWNEEVRKSLFLKKEEMDIMLLFGDMLGTSDISGQLSSIELYRKKLEYLHSGLRKDYERKGRMYCSVGLLSGIMAGILLL